MRFGGCEVGGDVLVGRRDVSVARPVENGEVGRGKRVGNSGNEAGYSRFCCDYRRCSVGKTRIMHRNCAECRGGGEIAKLEIKVGFRCVD